MRIVFLGVFFFIIFNLCGAERSSHLSTNLQNVESLDPHDIYFVRPKHYCYQPLTMSSLFFPNNTELTMKQDCLLVHRCFTWWYDEQLADDIILLNLITQDLESFQIYEHFPAYCLVHHITCKQLAEVINKVNLDTVFECYEVKDVQKNNLKNSLIQLYTAMYRLEKILDLGDYYEVTDYLSSFFKDLDKSKNYPQSFKIFLAKNRDYFIEVNSFRKQGYYQLILCSFGLFLMVTYLRYGFNTVNQGHQNDHYSACARCAEQIKFENALNNVSDFVFDKLILQGMQGFLLGVSVYKIYQFIVHTIRYKQLKTVIAALENQIIKVHEVD